MSDEKKWFERPTLAFSAYVIPFEKAVEEFGMFDRALIPLFYHFNHADLTWVRNSLRGSKP
jgi:hypothetical protein